MLVIILLTSCAVSNTNTPETNNENNIQTNTPEVKNTDNIKTNEPETNNEDNVPANDPEDSNEDIILTYNPKAYNVDNILKTIADITSEEFNGRGAGTPGGSKTEEYFAAKFKEIGLKPGGDNNTYYQAFNGVKGDTVGPYILELVDGDKVIKTYKYGTDYKLLSRFPCSGEVTASGKLVEEASADMPKVSGEIALLRNYPNSNSTDPRILIDLNNAGYGGVSSRKQVKGTFCTIGRREHIDIYNYNANY